MVQLMYKSVDYIANIISSGGKGWWFKDSVVKMDNKLSAYVIQSSCHFNMEYNSENISDSYDLEIRIPYNYPRDLPQVREINNRIPKFEDYHNSAETGLCLATPVEIRCNIADNTGLDFFIHDFIIQFLYANSYKEKYAKYPWPTQDHRYSGILDYYRELFGFNNNRQTDLFLREIYKHNKKALKKHVYCPCGSGKKFYECHKKQYEDMCKYYKHKDFVKDLEQVYRKALFPDSKLKIIK